MGGGPPLNGAGGCIDPFMPIPMLPFACAGAGGSPCPSCGGPTNDGGPLANRVCGRFFVAFGLFDANIRSAHKNPLTD